MSKEHKKGMQFAIRVEKALVKTCVFVCVCMSVLHFLDIERQTIKHKGNKKICMQVDTPTSFAFAFFFFW